MFDSWVRKIPWRREGFPGDSAGKESACNAEPQNTWVLTLGWEDPVEKDMATHSSILAWKIPWIEEPGGLQSMGSQRVWAQHLYAWWPSPALAEQKQLYFGTTCDVAMVTRTIFIEVLKKEVLAWLILFYRLLTSLLPVFGSGAYPNALTYIFVSWSQKTDLGA